MSKHTPGPYEVRAFLPRQGAGSGHFQIIQIQDGSAHIASIWILEKTPHAIAEANAKLFAAAPDLLEACKLALTYLQHEQFKDGDAYPSLLRAIEKAEGK